jgi:hypothetical protein
MNLEREQNHDILSRIKVLKELWERKQRERNEEEEETDILADFSRLKNSSIFVSRSQEDPDDQPLGVEEEPAILITTTMEREGE